MSDYGKADAETIDSLYERIAKLEGALDVYKADTKLKAAQVAELTERLAQFKFVDVEYFGSDYGTEVHVYHGPPLLEADDELLHKT